MDHLQDFIARAQKMMKEAVKEATKNDSNNRWHRENREKSREVIRKYSKTDKGRYTSSKRSATRRKFFEAACEDLSWDEKHQIGRFYKNCPPGYEVDHIIPVSRGGKHRLSNLQYLTKEENRRKSNRLEHEI